MNDNDRLKKARSAWKNRGSQRPPFAIEPKKGQRSVWDFPRPPAIEEVNKEVVVQFKGETLVKTNLALAVLETASPPTYYIPRGDIEMNLLKEISGKSSFCEWKGKANYWALKENSNKSIAWSYAEPFSEFEVLKNHLAFYPQHLDCYIGGDQVKAQPGEFYAGWITPDLIGPFKGESGTGHW